MLARSFLSPVDLKISDKQLNALVQVLNMLERGELPWHRGVSRPKDLGFNMGYWPDKRGKDCGTVGCIGYWTEKFLGEEFDDFPKELDNLFFINEIDIDWVDVTPEYAASALRNYLTTGKADWAGVLA